MDSCGKKLAARDIKIASLKNFKKNERKRLIEKKKELEKSVENNHYLNGALKECNSIIQTLKTQNEEQEDALENIYEYLENRLKDQNLTAEMMKDLKSQKKLISKKLKELKQNYNDLSN